MKTFYLVDFENLHEASLNITNKATANDEVLLFLIISKSINAFSVTTA